MNISESKLDKIEYNLDECLEAATYILGFPNIPVLAQGAASEIVERLEKVQMLLGER